MFFLKFFIILFENIINGFFQYSFFYNLREKKIKKIEIEQVTIFSNPSVFQRRTGSLPNWINRVGDSRIRQACTYGRCKIKWQNESKPCVRSKRVPLGTGRTKGESEKIRNRGCFRDQVCRLTEKLNATRQIHALNQRPPLHPPPSSANDRAHVWPPM